MCMKDLGQDLPIIGTAEMANVAVLMSLELSRLQHLDSRDNYLNASQLELIGKETGSRLLNGVVVGWGAIRVHQVARAPNQVFKASFLSEKWSSDHDPQGRYIGLDLLE